MTRYLAPLAVFILLSVFLALGLKLDPKLVPSPLIGKAAPSFQLPRLDNPEAQLRQQDFLGKVSLLNVWASWCAACRDEHEVLMRLSRMGLVELYGLNYKDDRQDALRWLANLGNPYLASGFDETGRVGIDWGVYGVPETFVVDREGIIRHKVIGPLNDNQVREELLPLIRALQKQ